MRSVVRSYSGCFGFIFGQEFSSPLGNGFLLVKETGNRMLITFLNHECVCGISKTLSSRVQNVFFFTLILLRSSWSSCICPLFRLHLSLHLSSRGGSRRFITSDASTDKTKVVSGYKWCSTRKDTSSGCWGKPSRINPADLRNRNKAVKEMKRLEKRVYEFGGSREITLLVRLSVPELEQNFL